MTPNATNPAAMIWEAGREIAITIGGGFGRTLAVATKRYSTATDAELSIESHDSELQEEVPPAQTPRGG